MPLAVPNDTRLPPITHLISAHHAEWAGRDIQKLPAGLLSPLSSMDSPVTPAWEVSRTTRLAQDLRLKMVACTDSERRTHHLRVPECDTSGWFDKDNHFMKYVLQSFGHLDLPQLISAWFTRGEHPEYGEGHVSTRNKRPIAANLTEDDDSSVRSFSKQHEGHKEKERERRDRHRVLQKEVHDCTSDVVFRLAEDKLPALKKEIAEMPKPEPSTSQARKSKSTGKDEQLAAAAFLPHLSNMVIFRLLDALAESEREIAALQRDIRDEQTAYKRLEAKIAHLEQDVQPVLEQRYIGLHPAIDISSRRDSLPMPGFRKLKRSFADMDDGSRDEQLLVKRHQQQHEYSRGSLGPTEDAREHHQQHHLPPSPSSDASSPVSANTSFASY